MKASGRQMGTILDHRRRIRRVMRHIYLHLDQECPLELMSNLAAMSPFHFHRIFAYYTGETLHQYHFRKRMEWATLKLIDPSVRIIDIAMEIGYESHNAFCKAFKKFYGCSPTAFREDPIDITAFGNFGLAVAKKRSFKPPSAPVYNLPRQPVHYIETTGCIDGTFEASGQAIAAKLESLLNSMELTAKVQAWVGVLPCRPLAMIDKAARFQVGVIMSATTKLPPPLRLRMIGGGRYVIYRYMGPYQYLNQVWTAVYFGWLPALGLIPRGAAAFEWYQDAYRGLPEETRRTILYIPVE
jgi:AraC family transcriptional regulator